VDSFLQRKKFAGIVSGRTIKEAPFLLRPDHPVISNYWVASMNQFPLRTDLRRSSNLPRGEFFSVDLLRQLIRNFVALVCLLTFGLISLSVSAADAEAVTANAKDQAPIVIHLKQFKVVKDEKGEQQFIDAALVLPGDVIEYRASYANRGKTALPVVATMPIPESMEYIKESAKAKDGLAHKVALKDSQFSNEPLLRKVVTASGATLSQPLPYASYRYVRWDLGRLSPGNSIEVSVRAKVSQNLDVEASVEDKTTVLASALVKK
jgi:uncharacterized repeat protein (TIGR01451 family)